MAINEYLVNIVGLASLVTIITLAIVLIFKMERLRQMQYAVGNLQKSLDEMDEQAKLIVRTDMELNRTQEELDKKIAGLYTLQRLSREIATTLEEDQIFKMIKSTHLEELGFEKALAFLWNDKEKAFVLKLSIGYFEDEVIKIASIVNADKPMYLNLMENDRTLSPISITEDSLLIDKINQLFNVNTFVVSPVLPKEGRRGFLFVGTESLDVAITEGDEELIIILANQIGQALENSRLFEKTWLAQQDLERKVEQRTHELKLALEEVNKINKRKSDFISAVSHELRTPLTSIKGYASILLAGKLGELPEEVHNRLDKINRHSDELVSLVNELLDIARIESGRIAMKRETCNLNNTATEVMDLLAMQLKEKQIEVSVNIPADASNVWADVSQIKRVFINTVGNAIKFTPQNGKITISSHKTDKMVQVDIADTGCGIPEEAQEVIFEEFYRVDNPINQELKGTGLGLSLVKRIVEAHGGKIWVKSRVGAGSVFSLLFPQQT